MREKKYYKSFLRKKVSYLKSERIHTKRYILKIDRIFAIEFENWNII